MTAPRAGRPEARAGARFTAPRAGRPETAGVTGAALLAGFGADLVLGDPRRFHPVAGFGRVAALLERALWRPSRAAGVLHTALLVGGAALAGRALGGAATRPAARRSLAGRALGGVATRPAARRSLPGRARAGAATHRPGALAPRARHAAALAVSTWAALGGRSLAREACRVADLVDAGDLPAARRAVTALVGRDPSALDGGELCRAAVESVAENTVDAVVAPLLWGAAAGPAGVLGYRAANTLDAMVGHRTPRYERFGWAAARLDDILTFPAARATAAATVVLAPLAGGSPAATARTVRRDGARHPSPNGGRAEAAFAGALGVRLGGTNVYANRVEHRPHLGDGRAPTPGDVRRAAGLARAVGALAAVAAASSAPLARHTGSARGGAALLVAAVVLAGAVAARRSTEAGTVAARRSTEAGTVAARRSTEAGTLAARRPTEAGA